MFLSASLWGLYWIPLRYLESRGIEGSLAVALLNVPAIILLTIIVLPQWKQYHGFVGKAIAIGVFTGIGIALYATGLVYSSVVRATLLFYLTPIWATLIGIFWLGEKASWQRWFAICGGLCGLMLLVSGDSAAPLNIGDVYAFLSGIFWAFGASMIKRYDDVPLFGMTLLQFVFTAIGAIALGYIASFVEWPSTQVVTQVMPTVALISIFLILPAVLILFWAQKFLFPGRVGLLMMTEVLTAVITASIFLPEERMSTLEWAGAALIIGACLMEVFMTPQET